MNINNKTNKESGQVMLVLVVVFLFVSMVVVFGIINPILKQVSISKASINSSHSFYLAESSLEDVLFRLKNNRQISATEVLSLNNAMTTTLITDTATGKQVVSTASRDRNYRRMQTNVQLGVGAAFYYGVQAGLGGFNLENSSSIIGNVYSAGPVVGNGNMIYGDVVSSGSSGLINDIHATGNAYSHTIQNSTIDKDAYYVNRSGTTVIGNSYPNSPDLPDAPLPISDEQIDIWKAEAEAGGTVTCSGSNYNISSNTTIGPRKIPCNLVISGTPTVNLSGPVWVVGNITIQNSSIIKVASSLGNKSVVLIADNPSDREGSSRIVLQNSTSFQNSGTAGSYIFLISRNTNAESGGSTQAISNSNSSGGAAVLYAPHGLITLQNSINVKEVTAYRITLQNSAQIRYDTGLPSTLFSSGPGGGYDVLDWKEIP